MRKKIMLTMLMFLVIGGFTSLPVTKNVVADSTSVIVVHAANNESDDITQEAREQMGDLVDKIVTIVGFIALGIGAILTAIGIFQLILSTTDANGESKKAAAQFAVAGIILMFSLPILKGLKLGDIVTGKNSNSSTKTTQSEAETIK